MFSSHVAVRSIVRYSQTENLVRECHRSWQTGGGSTCTMAQITPLYPIVTAARQYGCRRSQSLVRCQPSARWHRLWYLNIQGPSSVSIEPAVQSRTCRLRSQVRDRHLLQLCVILIHFTVTEKCRLRPHLHELENSERAAGATALPTLGKINISSMTLHGKKWVWK